MNTGSFQHVSFPEHLFTVLRQGYIISIKIIHSPLSSLHKVLSILSCLQSRGFIPECIKGKALERN